MTDAPFTPLQREVLKGYLPTLTRMHAESRYDFLHFTIHGEAVLDRSIEPEPKPVPLWPGTVAFCCVVLGACYIIGKVFS